MKGNPKESLSFSYRGPVSTETRLRRRREPIFVIYFYLDLPLSRLNNKDHP
jgi:hypothetical protein